MQSSKIKIIYLFLSSIIFLNVSCSQINKSHVVPHLIVINAKVVTLDSDRPIAQAIAMHDGKFFAVGNNSQILALGNSQTQIIDAQERTILPGLNDGHIHMVRAGFWWKYEARLDEAHSIAEILEIISNRAQRTATGTWILTLGGWHYSQIKDRRMPTLKELDTIAPNHPVYIQALREVGQMNTAAIRLSGINQNTILPPGVSIGKDSEGNFNGLIRGFAGQTLAEKSFPKQSFNDKVEGLRLVMQDFNAAGLTSVGETFGIGVDESDYQVLFELWRRRQMTVRVGAHFPTMNYEQAKKWLDFPAPSFGDDMLLLNGLGEGVLSSMGDGYIPKQFPISLEAKKELQKIVAAGAKNQVNFQFHATLETTMNAMLDSIEGANELHRLEKLRLTFLHAEQITPEIITRMKKLGMGVQMQNRQTLGSDQMRMNWGNRDLEIAPVKTVFQSGIPFAGGTDGTTSSSYRPFISLAWLVTGKNWRGDLVRPTEKLTREQALHLYTKGSAWFTWEENRKGSIKPGMLADFIVLNRDYLTVHEDDLHLIRPLLTVVGGKIVFNKL